MKKYYDENNRLNISTSRLKEKIDDARLKIRNKEIKAPLRLERISFEAKEGDLKSKLMQIKAKLNESQRGS